LPELSAGGIGGKGGRWDKGMRRQVSMLGELGDEEINRGGGEVRRHEESKIGGMSTLSRLVEERGISM
jgi:hypothetical protein